MAWTLGILQKATLNTCAKNAKDSATSVEIVTASAKEEVASSYCSIYNDHWTRLCLSIKCVKNEKYNRTHPYKTPVATKSI